MLNKRRCPCCERSRVGPIRIWRTMTRFTDDSLNYMESCYHCILENDFMRHYDWQEYYSSQYGYYGYTPYENIRQQSDYVKCLTTLKRLKT